MSRGCPECGTFACATCKRVTKREDRYPFNDCADCGRVRFAERAAIVALIRRAALEYVGDNFADRVVDAVARGDHRTKESS